MTQVLEPGVWYGLCVETDYDSNRYVSFRLTGGGLDRKIDLSGYRIAGENKSFTEEGFWLTAESENLWSCQKPAIYENRVYYDDAQLLRSDAAYAAEGVNAASFTATSAPGSWFTIIGANLANTTRLWKSSDFSGSRMPTTLDGVSVTVNGKSAPMLFISPSQINALAPGDAGLGNADVVVTSPRGRTVMSMPIRQFAPGFFMLDRTNIAAVHGDGALVGKSGLLGSAVATRPARPGEIIQTYCTGLGPTSPTVSTQEVFQGAASIVDAQGLTVLIGGLPARVSFAGLVSNGLYQINVTIPESLADGDYPIVATIGGVGSQSNAQVTVAR